MTAYYEIYLIKSKQPLIHVTTEKCQLTLCQRWIVQDGRWYFNSSVIDTKRITCKQCLKRYSDIMRG
jgi:hypothetical protein